MLNKPIELLDSVEDTLRILKGKFNGLLPNFIV